MNLTWNDLKAFIETMPEEHRSDTATIYDADDDEYYPIQRTGICTDGVLDDGCLYLVFNADEDDDA